MMGCERSWLEPRQRRANCVRHPYKRLHPLTTEWILEADKSHRSRDSVSIGLRKLHGLQQMTATPVNFSLQA
jgi:hypothetical protein